MTSPGEVVSVFTSLYLSAGAPALGEAKGLIKGIYNEKSDIYSLGCIIYELFNLNIYYKDVVRRKIKNLVRLYVEIN